MLIDASPDLASQLERERIERLDRIFITHWHTDHVAGLPELAEPSALCRWPPLDVYVPAAVSHRFDRELAFLKPRLNVHAVVPGDVIALPDAHWEVVKTDHTEHSVGFIVRAGRTVAYLVDGVVPPAATLDRLQGCDLLVTEATLDELDAVGWKNFSVGQATDFWQQTGAPECVLTHCSCHSWQKGRLVPGWSEQERAAFERGHAGLRFARDGMRVGV